MVIEIREQIRGSLQFMAITYYVPGLNANSNTYQLQVGALSVGDAVWTGDFRQGKNWKDLDAKGRRGFAIASFSGTFVSGCNGMKKSQTGRSEVHQQKGPQQLAQLLRCSKNGLSLLLILLPFAAPQAKQTPTEHFLHWSLMTL